jgi:hypothetical protein
MIQKLYFLDIFNYPKRANAQLADLIKKDAHSLVWKPKISLQATGNFTSILVLLLHIVVRTD